MEKEEIEAAAYLISCLCPYIKRMAKKTTNKIDDAVANLICNSIMGIVAGENGGDKKE